MKKLKEENEVLINFIIQDSDTSLEDDCSSDYSDLNHDE